MSDASTFPTSAAPVASVTLADYGRVGALIAIFVGFLVYLAGLADGPVAKPELILGPVFGLVGLLAFVWLLMVLVRNWATFRGLASPGYYLTYAGQQPQDWIERPARTFNNLLQLPTLFYVICALMLITGQLDRAQLAYAWTFVAMRAVHALVYIRWNPLPYRFATWLMSSVTLFVMWARFALQAWPGF
jgi:hypothetical protein